VVGVDQHAFYVPEKPLRQYSTFFDTALKKEWQEGKTKEVYMPEDDHDVFNIYLHWLLLGTFPCKDPDTASDPKGFIMLAKIYCLAEKLIDPRCQNAVLDTMVLCHQKERWCPAQTTATTIYEGTPRGSPARKLLVDMHLLRGRKDFLFDEPAHNNHEFLYDLAVAFLNQKSGDKRPELQELNTGVVR
jgi:hypothetical protein